RFVNPNRVTARRLPRGKQPSLRSPRVRHRSISRSQPPHTASPAALTGSLGPHPTGTNRIESPVMVGRAVAVPRADRCASQCPGSYAPALLQPQSNHIGLDPNRFLLNPILRRQPGDQDGLGFRAILAPLTS